MSTVIAGQTAPVKKQLFADGAPFNLAGSTIQILGTTDKGVSWVPLGILTVTSEVNGIVDFYPEATDFKTTDLSIQVRFRVTRPDGKITFFPTKRPDFWEVQRP